MEFILQQKDSSKNSPYVSLFLWAVLAVIIVTASAIVFTQPTMGTMVISVLVCAVWLYVCVMYELILAPSLNKKSKQSTTLYIADKYIKLTYTNVTKNDGLGSRDETYRIFVKDVKAISYTRTSLKIDADSRLTVTVKGSDDIVVPHEHFAGSLSSSNETIAEIVKTLRMKTSLNPKFAAKVVETEATSTEVASEVVVEN